MNDTTAVANRATSVILRPRFEGANIRTWIGFKHFMYLAEEAVLAWFRERGLGPHRLYHEYGLGLSVVDSSALLPAVLEVDDEVRADATEESPGRFTVRLRSGAGSGPSVLRATVRVALVRELDAGVPPPDAVAGLVRPSAAVGSTVDDPVAEVAPDFAWTWRIPYFYCQYGDRIAHAGYLRALEEVVDRFLADRGISVRRMLDERGWIPVVSRARVRLLADARMEETVRTTFTVTDLVRDVMFDGQMDCHVQRGGVWVPVATGRILHGYAISRGSRAGQLAELDTETVRALTGAPTAVGSRP